MAGATVLQRPALAAVRPEELLPLPVAQAITGLGTGAFRTLRRKGLSVQYCCGKGFVLGADLIAAIKSNAKPTK